MYMYTYLRVNIFCTSLGSDRLSEVWVSCSKPAGRSEPHDQHTSGPSVWHEMFGTTHGHTVCLQRLQSEHQETPHNS